MANTLRKGKAKEVSKVSEGAIVDKNGKNLYVCYKCGNSSIMERFTNIVRSDLFQGMNYHIPICKDCMYFLYLDLLDNVYDGNVKITIKRICSMYDIYFNDEIYEASLKLSSKNPISNYLQMLGSPSFNMNKTKTFKNTIWEDNGIEPVVKTAKSRKIASSQVTYETRKFFGLGFDDEDYIFLNEQYNDWRNRAGIESKAQEEIIKNICFTQLQIQKTMKVGGNTKDLNATLQNLLNTGNLSPKQKASENSNDNISYGEWIKKLENERPVAEIDDEFKDVDRIGLYIDVFFKGHLSKMMGLKNGLSNLYDKFMKKYTVKKPEYQDDETNEALFDAIFGDANLEKEIDYSDLDAND